MLEGTSELTVVFQKFFSPSHLAVSTMNELASHQGGCKCGRAPQQHLSHHMLTSISVSIYTAKPCLHSGCALGALPVISHLIFTGVLG